MHEREPALAKLHVCDDQGRVDRGSRDRFALFLIGWLGGPDDYVMQHGHPRLRMRHAPFAIGPAERDAWLTHMRDAVDSLELPHEQDATLWGYLEMAARSMQNRIPGGHGDLSPA